MIIQALRSFVFYALFLSQTAINAVIITIMAQFAHGWFGAGWAIAKFWAALNLFMLRWIVGIKTEISGEENIPEGGCIIAAKHQSDWDIFALLPHVGRPAFIAKKELMDIPFFGRAAKSFDTITIDRKKGGQAIPAMTDDAKAAIARGCRIIIFPEGTRKAPLDKPSYRFGTAKLYEQLNVPVVPVALNSGLFWGRNSLVLWPGTARAKFLEPIPADLTPEDMQKRLIAAIEQETDNMIAKDVAKGLTRPITPELRVKLDALAERQK